MAEARKHLGADVVSGVLGISKSALDKGCNPNDQDHGFPRLTWSQVETLIRKLNAIKAPEHFSDALASLSEAPRVTAADVHRGMTALSAGLGSIAGKLQQAETSDSEMGEDISPSEGAALDEALDSHEHQIETMRAAVRRLSTPWGQRTRAA